MSLGVVVPGKTLVRIGPGGGSLQSLGYTRDSVDCISEGFFQDVPGDENGGEAGPPIDILYLGEIARVRVELTKFDTTVASIVEARVNGATVGTPAATGSLMFAGTYYMTLALVNTNAPRTFNRAIPRSAIQMNRGSKFATFVCEWECHKDGSGVLFTNS
ncbi:MAG TPA: hypothetical protein VG713_05445 [Pirellulales bacterium]|nr:hypothetical protein [Pirellulales bacterium]